MARSRLFARLLPAVGLVLLTLPSITRAPQTAAAAISPRPILGVPSNMLHSAAVPVIVELRSPVAAGLAGPAPGSRQALSDLIQPVLNALHGAQASNVYAFHHIPAVAATVAGSVLPSILAQPNVRAVVLDRYHPLLPLPSADGLQQTLAKAVATGPIIDEPQTKEPESYSLTRADVAQANGYKGQGVRVAIIDSGLDLTVPDLAATVARDKNGVPLRVDFTGTDLTDTVGHGTACASMIASRAIKVYEGDTRYSLQVYPAQGANAPIYRTHFRVYGMAPDVQLMSAKIFDSRAPHGGGFDSWIVRAIEWAVDHHADVISESFGGLSVPSDGTDPIGLADQAAIAAGVTVVAADGNEGPGQSTISSPANAPGVIAVGASTQYRNFGQTGFLARFGFTTSDNIASFTSRGPTTDGRPRPDLVAPGAFSWALFPTKHSEESPDHPPYNVGTFGGTSQATPVVAGAAALVISAFRRAHGGVSPSPALVRAILMSSAHDLGYPAFDQGSGRLDAWKAIQTAIHSGQSFLLNPASIAAAGPIAAPFSTTFSVTNTGSLVQTYSFDAVQSHLIGINTFKGQVRSTEAHSYTVDVKPGLERMVAAVYWNSADRFNVQGSSKEVALRVSLYDPLGRFVNYSYGVGTGYANAQVSHPMAGRWTMVVTENGRKDNAGVRRYTKENYTARLSSFVTVPFGAFSSRSVALMPGHAAHITLSGRMPVTAGSQVVTVHVHGDHTAALAIALTAYITLHGSHATFSGDFTGPSNAYFSLANENKVYSLNVAPGAHSLSVFLSWPDPGYGVIALLIDPSGQIVDGQFNGISNGSADGPFDLSAHNLEMIWSNPRPGRWQIVVMDAVFAGKQASERFSGRVTFDDSPVLPLQLTRTVLPGSTFDIDLQVHNDNGPNVAEGYIGYATSDTYGKVPLGVVRGPFGNPARIAGSDVYTYTTKFVPPGTHLVVSRVAIIHPSVTADLAFADPIGFTRSEGLSKPVTIDGKVYQGTEAVVEGTELPIGDWNAEVTLRRPFNSGTHATIVAESYAESLAPLPWIAFDHSLKSGRITGGQPLILLPGQADVLHASVTVPLGLRPGTYHAHLYVISVFADKVADVPLTLTVRRNVGTEPAH
ncbi:MAG TPA: S8 family serine peptidase [Chloroflexota bacterium]|nr:S8 family serine peptidase [Chloroflexota bacterium]